MNLLKDVEIQKRPDLGDGEPAAYCTALLFFDATKIGKRCENRGVFPLFFAETCCRTCFWLVFCDVFMPIAVFPAPVEGARWLVDCLCRGPAARVHEGGGCQSR